MRFGIGRKVKPRKRTKTFLPSTQESNPGHSAKPVPMPVAFEENPSLLMQALTSVMLGASITKRFRKARLRRSGEANANQMETTAPATSAGKIEAEEKVGFVSRIRARLMRNIVGRSQIIMSCLRC